jgi:4-amino-4-deoxy-L-arabinose transferase-like glycosyltransferase
MKINYSTKTIISVLIGLIFVVSFSYAMYHQIHPVVDAKAYDRIALNIIEGNGFREEAGVSFEFDRSIQRAGPAYEFFLAGIYSIFGFHNWIVWFFQAILLAISSFLIYCIAKRIFPNKGAIIGIIAAILFGLHPDLIEISAMIMTETLYLFFTVLVMYLFVRVYEEPDLLFFASLLGTFTAIGILSRPPILLFIPIIFIFYFIKKKYIPLVVFLVTCFLLLVPWTVRNYQIYNQFIPTTLIGEYNIWVGNTLKADGGQLGGGYNPFNEHVESEGFMTIRVAARDAFKTFLIEEPLQFIKLTAIRTVRFFSLIRPMGFWFYQTGISQMIFVASSAIAIAILFISGFSGMFALLKKKKTIHKYLAALALSAPILLLITVVQSRYRFQIYPFLALFGGYFFYMLFTEFKDVKKYLLYAAAGLFAFTIIDVFFFWDLIISRVQSLLG